MKKLQAVILFVSMMYGVVIAQETPYGGSNEGDKSLNFTFGGLGTFALGAAGINNGLSLSYFLSSDAAARIGLQIKSNSSTTPWNDVSGNNTDPGSDGSTSAFALGIGADYLMFMGNSGKVKPYIGAGFSISLNSSNIKSAISNAAANGTITERKNTAANDGMTLGLAGIAGAQLFLYPELSVSGEYNFTLFSLTSRSDSETSRKGQTATTTKNGSATQILGFGSAGAAIHIYF